MGNHGALRSTKGCNLVWQFNPAFRSPFQRPRRQRIEAWKGAPGTDIGPGCLWVPGSPSETFSDRFLDSVWAQRDTSREDLTTFLIGDGNAGFRARGIKLGGD
jgi:hypothetical protein